MIKGEKSGPMTSMGKRQCERTRTHTQPPKSQRPEKYLGERFCRSGRFRRKREIYIDARCSRIRHISKQRAILERRRKSLPGTTIPNQKYNSSTRGEIFKGKEKSKRKIKRGQNNITPKPHWQMGIKLANGKAG